MTSITLILAVRSAIGTLRVVAHERRDLFTRKQIDQSAKQRHVNPTLLSIHKEIDRGTLRSSSATDVVHVQLSNRLDLSFLAFALMIPPSPCLFNPLYEGKFH